jgi:hypothetical protein
MTNKQFLLELHCNFSNSKVELSDSNMLVFHSFSLSDNTDNHYGVLVWKLIAYPAPFVPKAQLISQVFIGLMVNTEYSSRALIDLQEHTLSIVQIFAVVQSTELSNWVEVSVY